MIVVRDNILKKSGNIKLFEEFNCFFWEYLIHLQHIFSNVVAAFSLDGSKNTKKRKGLLMDVYELSDYFPLFLN